MTRALLDVNVLLALLDREHVHHERARTWYVSDGPRDWASCAITQNGYIRVVSQARYPNPTTVADAHRRLGAACAAGRHEFWPCSSSILDVTSPSAPILRSASVTDAYLLGLAVAYNGRLATFDRHVPVEAVVGAGAEHLVVL